MASSLKTGDVPPPSLAQPLHKDNGRRSENNSTAARDGRDGATPSSTSHRLALKLSSRVASVLRCPACGDALTPADENLRCANDGCAALFPVVDGVPILINEQSSLFAIQDLLPSPPGTETAPSPFKQWASRLLMPELSRNAKGKANYRTLAGLLLKDRPDPLVLVVGGRTLGAGMGCLLEHPSIELVETDIAFGPRTKLLCDARDLPFPDGTFDAVTIQAVLDCLVDPFRAIEEIHRVLKPGGLVYAETSFLQPIHDGRYDFLRFTPLGHRRAFRHFAEISSGSAGGPGSAMGLLYHMLLLGFVSGMTGRRCVSMFARLTGFWMKYLDCLVIDRPSALDAASGSYFLGRKSEQVLPDWELIRQYRGAQHHPGCPSRTPQTRAAQTSAPPPHV